MHDMMYLAIIWGGVFISSYMANKTKLTPVLYFLAFGSVMVNMGILPEESSEFIKGFAEIGIILIMFALGFEEDSSHFVKGIKRSWGIALFGAIAPFVIAYVATWHFWHDARLSMMCGLAMTATAVSLTMVSLKSENLQTSAAARGIMTSAILDDVASLVLVAIMVPVATGAAEISIAGIALILLKTALFFAIVTLLGIYIFPSRVTKGIFRYFPFVNALGLKDLLSTSNGEKATLTILLVALLVSLLAYFFGFHPAVGAYMAGLIMKQEYFNFSQTETAEHYDNTKKIIDDVAFSWIGPVFFVELGTKLIFELDIFVSVIPEIIILTTGLIFAQILSASLAARYTGSYQWHESVMIGIGMLGRAELAFVVMDIGMRAGLFTTESFYTLMCTSFWLNICVPLGIKWWKPYYSGQKKMAFNIGKQKIMFSKPPEPE